MPFFTIDTWHASAETKKKWIFEATRLTCELLSIAPDKIQMLFRTSAQENFGKAGAVPTSSDFAEKSRLMNWGTDESYDDGQSEVPNMAIICIDVWNFFNQEQKDEWVRLLTNLSVDLLNAPPDKVLILIRDMPPGNWGQTGITGTDPEFLHKSRTLGQPQR